MHVNLNLMANDAQDYPAGSPLSKLECSLPPAPSAISGGSSGGFLLMPCLAAYSRPHARKESRAGKSPQVERRKYFLTPLASGGMIPPAHP
jgi:hypothetical protein